LKDEQPDIPMVAPTAATNMAIFIILTMDAGKFSEVNGPEASWFIAHEFC
jgi:hypothetical protein